MERERDFRGRGGRDWSDIARSQGTPRSHQTLEKTRKHGPLEPLREYGTRETSISDFWPPQFKRIKSCFVLFFKSLSLWSFVVAATGNSYSQSSPVTANGKERRLWSQKAWVQILTPSLNGWVTASKLMMIAVPQSPRERKQDSIMETFLCCCES